MLQSSKSPGGLVEQESIPFTLREQTSELCDAGSRQWTGSVNVTSDKSIFFWFFESRHDPENDPLILWMSGGPGASGQLGLFLDVGPCAVNQDANSTTRLDYSWTDHANVVFVDQPSGVGFSHIADRNLIPVDLHEGGRDMYTFLATFTTSVFPDLGGRPIHITGESMGGHYVAGYTQYITSRQKEPLAGSAPLNVASAIIVDGYIDSSSQSSGYYDFFCTDWSQDGRDFPLMNATACEDMAAAVPRCEFLGARCRETYDDELCNFAFEWCEENVGKYYWGDVKPGGWNPYDSRTKCVELPLCFDLDGGVTSDFLNRPWVQERLGFANVSYRLIDFDVGDRWVAGKQLFLPVTRELTWLLDHTDVNIMFLNGNNDIIINTPGQIRMLDRLPWHGQAWYRSQQLQDWFYQDGGAVRGGSAKGNGRLKLVTFDQAGHFAPLHQPEAVTAVLWDWIRR
ncbi:carboxypeptidase Y [Ilyonectria sp. MPI-CAGE-AT-0026]|nr:carboxypeptidase Y [Ilyonectria sp. MPI-CAGE-AT-0026]